VQRDIPTSATEAGVDRTNLRQYIGKIMKERKIACRCIRCREPRNAAAEITGNRIVVREYGASGGREFFISAEDGNEKVLLGFCRLRFPSASLRKEIASGTALVRELHVFGTAAALGKMGDVQHRGHGKALLMKAEQIAKGHNMKKIIVISRIGARGYYRNLGYRREGPYMAKKI
jgi:elongator complex protein 3